MRPVPTQPRFTDRFPGRTPASARRTLLRVLRAAGITGAEVFHDHPDMVVMVDGSDTTRLVARVFASVGIATLVEPDKSYVTVTGMPTRVAIVGFFSSSRN